MKLIRFAIFLIVFNSCDSNIPKGKKIATYRINPSTMIQLNYFGGDATTENVIEVKKIVDNDATILGLIINTTDDLNVKFTKLNDSLLNIHLMIRMFGSEGGPDFTFNLNKTKQRFNALPNY